MALHTTTERGPGLLLRTLLAAEGIFILTRAILLGMSGASAAGPRFWPRVFLLGLWPDLLVLAAMSCPLLLGAALVPDRLRRWKVYPWLRLLGAWGLSGLLLFVAVAEVTFWQEFSTRFNFIAVDYLLYTHEVIGNIQESYPMGWIFTGIAVAALGLAWWITRPASAGPRSWKRRGLYALLAVALPLASFALGNIDQTGGSGNAYADELTGNGWMTFAAAARRNELDYDQFYTTMPQPEADRLLAGLGVARRPLSPGLPTPKHQDGSLLGPLTRAPRNVVLVSVESLSAEYLGCYGSRRGLTPCLDRLSEEGYRFPDVYATGTRTVRGLEALSLGTPPVPGQAIVRRPHNEHLATLGEILAPQGFDPLFIYGGYGYFDNMNAYFQSNGYAVVDRTAFPKASIAFENVWGVDDGSLYTNALAVLRQHAATGRRFLAHIMTTSNHRPFTYPAGSIDIPSPGGRKGGVKFTDHALGQFIEAARKEPWFKDTLFVITADHCASVAGKSELPVDKYRIPMIWYGPGLVKPGVFQGMVSQLDVPPTLLGVLGVKGGDNLFGTSVFAQQPDRMRAFISNYQALGYLKHGILTVLLPKQRSEAYRVDPGTYEESSTAVDPALKSEAIAYYQTAAHAFRLGRLAAPPRP
ncbi:MAG TPA: LTA synthase family protein [Holophaga sp.]|nr:LTA synthase family protein [Holophaga sp.]